ncbi:MAG: holo-ACP synthase [Caldanaerobacter subterraneus]|nr:holo-ACP synthase [Caldanaerobacter subterraneus]
MEIFVGTDITEVERIKKILGKRPHFLERIFTEKEREFLRKKKNPWPHLAGFFSAKESVSKVLGTGIRGFSWQDIEIIHNEYGKPEVVLKGKAKAIAAEKGIKEIKLSISHTSDYAVSVAIAVGGEER